MIYVWCKEQNLIIYYKNTAKISSIYEKPKYSKLINFHPHKKSFCVTSIIP